MKILSWNCQGLGNLWIVKTLRDWCWREKPNIVFVMETMIDSGKLEKIRNSCGFREGVCISSEGNSGGLGFWWRDLKVETNSLSRHHFSADICDFNDTPVWRAVGVYGWPERENKHKTYSLLSSIKSSSSIPCVMFGDFNEIMSQDEKKGGNPRSERAMDAFRGAIDGCGLCDLGYRGSWFTWKRGKTIATFVRERLDRFLADMNWCNIFPHFSVKHLPIFHSDHAHIILSASDSRLREGKGKLFKF